MLQSRRIVADRQVDPAVLRAFVAVHGVRRHIATDLSEAAAQALLANKVDANTLKEATVTVNDPAAAELLLLTRPRRKTAVDALLYRFKFSERTISQFLNHKADAEHAELLLKYRLSPANLAAAAPSATPKVVLRHMLNRLKDPAVTDELLLSVLATPAYLPRVEGELLVLLLLRPSLVAPLLGLGSVAAAAVASSPEDFADADPASFANAPALLANPALPMSWRERIFAQHDRSVTLTAPDCWPVVSLTDITDRTLCLHLLAREATLVHLPQLIHLLRNRSVDDDVHARTYDKLRKLAWGWAETALEFWPELSTTYPALAELGGETVAIRRRDDSLLDLPDATVCVSVHDTTPGARPSTSTGATIISATDGWSPKSDIYPLLVERLGTDEVAWQLLFRLVEDMSHQSVDQLCELVRATLA